MGYIMDETTIENARLVYEPSFHRNQLATAKTGVASSTLANAHKKIFFRKIKKMVENGEVCTCCLFTNCKVPALIIIIIKTNRMLTWARVR